MSAISEATARSRLAERMINIGVTGCGGRIRNIIRRVLDPAPDGVRATALVDHDEQSRQELSSQAPSAISHFGVDQAQDEGRVINLRPLWQRAGIAV